MLINESWDSIKYLLDSYSGSVRCKYKGLEENLLDSLCLTFIKMRDELEGKRRSYTENIKPVNEME